MQEREGAISLTAKVTSRLEQGGVQEAWAFNSAAAMRVGPIVVLFSILPVPHASVVGNGWLQSNWISLACSKLKRLHNAWKFFRENRTLFLNMIHSLSSPESSSFLVSCWLEYYTTWLNWPLSCLMCVVAAALVAVFPDEYSEFHNIFRFQRNNIFMVLNHYLVRKNLMLVPLKDKCIWLRKLNFLLFSFSTKLCN